MKKEFLTYNQQMRHLRDDKKIACTGSAHKTMLCRYGYFNLINGYKAPFISGKDSNGNHIYYPETTIEHLTHVKKFDDNLRVLLLKYITQVEEEVRTFAAYKFDEVNKKGKLYWYQVNAFDSSCDTTNIVKFISDAFTEIHRSKLEYVQYYMEHHKSIPTWILTKVIGFSIFINFVKCSKKNVKDSLCNLYSIIDARGYNNYKLLIGSLHWFRIVRNTCAHNERVYTITDKNSRIFENYFSAFPNSYSRSNDKRIIDLLIYLKYYLSSDDYSQLIGHLQTMLNTLKAQIPTNSFNYVRAQMGIKDISHLEILLQNTKKIDYNKF